MANLFFSLPIVPNGIGAPVNISATGATKTITVTGPFSGILALEISVDAGVTWAPLSSFSRAQNEVVSFAASLIRVNSKDTNNIQPFLPMVELGANATGGAFAVIPAPPAFGIGATVNISSFGNFTTVIVGGAFSGVIGIEISENGVDFSEVLSFQKPGQISKDMVGDFIRATSRGVEPVLPFAPTCGLGAINDDFTSTLTIEHSGVTVGDRPILNFTGTAITSVVDDPPFNRVDVQIDGTALTTNAPTTIHVGDTAVVGVGTAAARDDHQHALPVPAAPVTVTGPTNSAGAATTTARADHQHRLALSVDNAGALVGSRPSINFTGTAVASVVDNAGSDRVDVTLNGVALTANAPTTIHIGDTAVVGVGTAAARDDHQHALPVPAAPVTVTGPTNSAGAATTTARADHQHRLALTVDVGGGLIGSRPILNFIGATAADNAGTDSVDVTIAGFTGGFPAGTVGAPGLFVIGDTDTGLYSAGANQLDVATGGSQSVAFTTQGEGLLQGAVGTPSLFFIADVTTGIYSFGAGALDITAAGVQSCRFTSQGIGIPVGTAALPGMRFAGNANTGIYSAGANQVDVATNGAQSAAFTTQGMGFLGGNVGAPGLFVIGNTNTGMYSGGAGVLALTAGGTEALQLTSQGVQVNTSGTVTTPQISFIGDLNTGFYQVGAHQVSVTANGTQAVNFTSQGTGIPSGAVGTPSLFVQGSTSTGLFSDAANNLVIAANGVELVRFAASTLFSKAARSNPVALTYGATIAIDAKASNQYTVTLTGITAILSNPTNLAAGETWVVIVTQDATGGRGLTFDTQYTFGAEGAPILTTSLANAIDIISCVAVTATKIACTTLRGF